MHCNVSVNLFMHAYCVLMCVVNHAAKPAIMWLRHFIQRRL